MAQLAFGSKKNGNVKVVKGREADIIWWTLSVKSFGGLMESLAINGLIGVN